MKLRFLGTGTSFGVPVLGCACDTCSSSDPRDRRTRHAALVEWEGFRLLIDTPPEVRLQLLDAGTDRLDAVWFTHAHADHIHGIDDLRAFTALWRQTFPCFVPRGCAELFHRRFPYIFDSSVRAVEGTSKPTLVLTELGPQETVALGGRTVVPLAVPHGPLTVFGLRVGNLGYITDAKTLPSEVMKALVGVDVLVINALWFGEPHPTHFNVEEAIEVARVVGARKTYLTHITHKSSQAEFDARLPDGVEAAYDGLTVEIEGS
jgi:phosphoribosyl 1,2-cyclic phosphate phosphodiesterase